MHHQQPPHRPADASHHRWSVVPVVGGNGDAEFSTGCPPKPILSVRCTQYRSVGPAAVMSSDPRDRIRQVDRGPLVATSIASGATKALIKLSPRTLPVSFGDENNSASPAAAVF